MAYSTTSNSPSLTSTVHHSPSATNTTTLPLTSTYSSLNSTKTPSTMYNTNVPLTTAKSALSSITHSTIKTTTTSSPPFTSTSDGQLCVDGGFIFSLDYSDYFNWWINYHDNTTWYNVTFWGGHVQIPWKNDLDYTCEIYNSSYFLALSEKHKDISDIGNEIMTVDAVIKNHTKRVMDVKVEMKTCNGDLLYRFPWTGNDDYDNNLRMNIYICFDKKYEDSCNSSKHIYTAGMVNEDMLDLGLNKQAGWFDAFRDGKQYVLPSFEDVVDVFERCLTVQSYGWGYFLREEMPKTIGDAPQRLSLCYVSNNNYYDYEEDYYYSDYCNTYVFARECGGKVQFDFSYFRYWSTGSFCLVHYNNVKVLPEIGHVTDDDGIHTPYLQFRCSFEMAGSYIVKWYINGSLWTERGPSSESDDLLFKGEELTNLRLGYEVKCGVIAIEQTTSNETFSDGFYAGWKISDTSIKLNKSGYAFVDVEQTVPLGCPYTENEQEVCEEILSLADPLYDESVCTAGIRVLNGHDTTKSYHTVKTNSWREMESDQKYRFKLATIDHDYDDKLYFDLNLLISKTSGLTPGNGNLEFINNVQVVVRLAEKHWNKMCYSHNDPHMRTGDGRYYTQQREGDHMFYRNQAFQSEVQESARYCSRIGGPVCACGVVVRFGADAFKIDRCGNYTVLDFLQCGDGGILDVERKNDYHYKVTTPIGTIVEISLNSWWKTLNIDIFLSAKDVSNTDGLCGNFDGDRNNDFRHRDGTTSDGNSDYAFSDSWRLSDEENLFKNGSRKLEHWNDGGPSERPCSRPNSITKNKCKFEERMKREDIVRRLGIESYRTNKISNQEFNREKRNVGTELSEAEARKLCNSSIYNAPALREFPDQLAKEDPKEVINQCVYDVVQGNDTVWVDAHVGALNNIVTAVLDLNPVFSTNHSESIKSFLSQTCLNNCSGNGACSDTGQCMCGEIFRGADCGTDLRIPPVIYDIEGGGVCDVTDDDDCTCFVIRTNNIFEGFMYEINTFKVYFDGTRKAEAASTHVGEYEDIFTGVCCVPVQRRRRDIDDPNSSILMHDITLSNDGNNYGSSKHVYVFDSTCLNLDISVSGDSVLIDLKEGYCYIGNVCIRKKSSLQTQDGCYLCSPDVNPYEWTGVSCNDDTTIGLTTAELSGIIAGAVIAGMIITLVVVYIRCCKGN